MRSVFKLPFSGSSEKILTTAAYYQIPPVMLPHTLSNLKATVTQMKERTMKKTTGKETFW
jgi:hypothetical protein